MDGRHACAIRKLAEPALSVLASTKEIQAEKLTIPHSPDHGTIYIFGALTWYLPSRETRHLYYYREASYVPGLCQLTLSTFGGYRRRQRRKKTSRIFFFFPEARPAALGFSGSYLHQQDNTDPSNLAPPTPNSNNNNKMVAPAAAKSNRSTTPPPSPPSVETYPLEPGSDVRRSEGFWSLTSYFAPSSSAAHSGQQRSHAFEIPAARPLRNNNNDILRDAERALVEELHFKLLAIERAHGAWEERAAAAAVVVPPSGGRIVSWLLPPFGVGRDEQ